eukprot:91053_1
MKAPPDDCMLVDFDTDENYNNIFPLYDTCNNEKEKQSAILEVINYMNTNNKIPKLATDDELQSPKIPTTIFGDHEYNNLRILIIKFEKQLRLIQAFHETNKM